MQLLLEIAVTCGLILAIAIPRLLDLNQFVTTDERLWLDRSGKFYYALVHHDFAATFQKSHPGVTVMWAGLVGYVAVYPTYYESRQGQNHPVSLYALKQQEFDLPLRILVAGRRTIILLGLLALVLSFLFARRLFGMLPALVGFLLIAFDPFHIALSRVLHVDGLLADLTLLSLLAFLVYLQEHSRAALVVSAVAAGLAWLTKSPGLFLIPLIALLALFDLLRTKSDLGRGRLAHDQSPLCKGAGSLGRDRRPGILPALAGDVGATRWTAWLGSLQMPSVTPREAMTRQCFSTERSIRMGRSLTLTSIRSISCGAPPR